MSFVSELFTGLRATGASFGVLRRAKLRYMYAIALVFTVFISMLGAWGIGWVMDTVEAWYVSKWLVQQTVASDELGLWERALVAFREGGRFLVQAAVFIALWWLKLKLLKYIVIVVLGPVMAWVSEQVEAHLTGIERPFEWRTWWREFVRGLRSAMLLFIWEMSLTALLFLFSLGVALFAGPIGVVVSPLLAMAGFALGAWFYGASVLDFVWERQGMGARKGLRQTAQSHGLALGLGLPFALWMVIPYVGWVLAPIIAPVTAAAAASIAVHQRVQRLRHSDRLSTRTQPSSP